MQEKFDVVIIGAGPAGCAAAIELGNRGLKVVMIEKGSPGKDKPCGDGFLSSAVAVLEEYSLCTKDLVESESPSFRSVLLYDEAKLVWEHSATEDLAWVMPRKVVDQKLRDIAARKAAIWYDCCAADVEFVEDQCWKVIYRKDGIKSLLAKGIILATGGLNKLSKKWNVSGQPQNSAAVSAYVNMEGVESLLFQFMKICKPGYGWIFPCGGNKVNIGVCALGQNETQLKSAANEYLNKWNIREVPTWRGGCGPLWSGEVSQWHHANGLVSCGDAAGLIDPINGEGITAALLSGRMAGISMHNYLMDLYNPQHLVYYSLYIYHHFKERYRDTVERATWKMWCQ